jgi:phytoene dehydrogenase-like protein
VTRRAVVVGAGPNGLTAAARLATAGWAVTVFEASATIGGGSRSAELIEPGVINDVCAAVHPAGACSPAFKELQLQRYGLKWRHPEIPLAHPLDGDRAAVLHRNVDDTAGGLAGPDGRRWKSLMRPLLERFDDVRAFTQGPLLRWPAHPITAARFGAWGVWPATVLARRFEHDEARALIGGLAAHSCLPLHRPFTAGLGLMLGVMAHAVGWPVAEGGSQAIVAALARSIEANGGEIHTSEPVRDVRDLPDAEAVLLDVAPRQLVRMVGGRLDGWRGRPYRRYRYGWSACKVDYVLSGPMPWLAEAARRAGTLHLGGSLPELVASEEAVARGRVAEAPFVLVAQATVVDPTRAPAGRHTLWAYCHVPNGDGRDASRAIEAQFDRWAPGWRDLVVGRSVRTASDFEMYNPSAIGGDFAGGSMDARQIFARPRASWNPYATPLPGVWLCSAATPPGAAVHGMCGWHAAGRVLASAARNGKLAV